MKRYLAHMQTREPHERRSHALQVASAFTGLLFVAWLGTLGLRLSGSDIIANEDGSQTASVAQAVKNNEARLEVSTTSVLTLPNY